MKKLRQQFADTVLEVGQRDRRLVVMVGDISHGILQPYAAACPGRYYNVGICEPTIVNMGAGLAMTGLIPVMHTIAPFITERAYEQIKLDFGYQNLSGTFISVGGAFDYAQLGCSHHCYTDVSLFGHLKRARIFLPGSPVEFDVLFKQHYAEDGINYFRLPETPHEVEFSAADIEAGGAIVAHEGTDATVVCIGTQLKHVMALARRLVPRGISLEVIYLHTLKPFDGASVRRSAEKTRRVLTVEELSAHDGVFNLVMRACLGLDGIDLAQLAIEDFVHGYDVYAKLSAAHGFSESGIEARLEKAFPGLLR